MSGFTPPSLGKARGVSAAKILKLIEIGELRAVNMATRRQGRPRWFIPLEAVQEFDRTRSNITATPAPTTSRRRKTQDVKEFF